MHCKNNFFNVIRKKYLWLENWQVETYILVKISEECILIYAEFTVTQRASIFW